MDDRNRAIDSRFRPHWRHYVLQSGLATVTVFGVLLALHHQNLVVAASLAATAFTVFAMPNSVTARTRNVVGGHLTGIVIGSIFAVLPMGHFAEREAFYALAVGCSMFLMAITNTEHPPAAGTALGMVIAGFSWRLGIGALIGVSILSLIQRLLRPLLIDLVLPPELDRPDPSDRKSR
jgi:CBS-domain-containing membrane protein